MLRTAGLGALALATPPMIMGCGDRGVDWHHYGVRGHLPDLSFSLTGPENKPFTQADVAGKTVILFFGYASCPDVCPTTMAQLTDVLRRLEPEQARGIRILFVSVDPHRDTPELLQAYVRAFSEHAIGLTGDERAIAALARRYRVAYQIEKPRSASAPQQYDVTHSRGIYVFDSHGRARLLAPDTADAQALAEDLQTLIAHT